MTNTIRNNLPVLTLNRIGKVWQSREGQVEALTDVSMDIQEGEFVSIVGPSGCGKSTLLNILAGLDAPSKGTILSGGTPWRDRLGHIGYMPQKDLLLPWRSVLDNAILAEEISGVSKESARNEALKMMGEFGLSGFEHNYPYQLSGGMKQRVALLRTVLADNELILLDEPFAALDALTRSNMHEWLLGLWESWHKTLILVTHDVEEALILSDRVYVLGGRPGFVKSVVSVDMSRPRSLAMADQADFLRLKKHVINLLKSTS
ncbi:MAG: ABC transporter ATP-binding protein [SAR202 cluster bacterium]|nr:ABC transporter ATP-binding protein [SAR202 cluster bacterium]